MTGAIILYSGGLDSRLVIAILKKQNLDLTAVYFNLPFGCSCKRIKEEKTFLKKFNTKLKIFDCTKEPLLSEHLNTLKHPKYGRGTGYNPCTDCKLFMLKKTIEYAKTKRIKIIATGEVLGQRPMSQTKKRIQIIDKEIDFEIIRPLSAKLLKETSIEKKGIINRKSLFDINGRNRKKQLELAKDFRINYKNPSGGCLLCEKAFKKRFKELIKRELITEKTLPLISIARHFIIDNSWYIVARNSDECRILDKYKKTLIGKAKEPSVYSNSSNKKVKKELQSAFRTGSTTEQRKKYEKYKI